MDPDQVPVPNIPPANDLHTDHRPRTLVFGGGYVGRRVARRVVQQGSEVLVTTRSSARADDIARNGWHPVIADWSSDAGLRSLDQIRLSEIDRVLISVSYDSRSGIGRYESQVIGLRRLLGKVDSRTSVVYISSTGVYHQTDGRWVDENSPARPRREGGQAHLAAEQSVRRRGTDSPWTILRLAGIYGPGRVPLAQAVRSGQPIASPAAGFLNLIHVEDAAAVVMAAWQRLDRLRSDRGAPSHSMSTANRLFAVADDEPVVRREFYNEVARQIGVGLPTFTESAKRQNQSARSASNKRVWNRSMKRELLSRLAFPTYREGLADILR